MSNANDPLSRRKALLRLSGLALGAYAAPAFTTLSSARASDGSDASTNSSGSEPSEQSSASSGSEPSEESSASSGSEPSEEGSASEPSEESSASLPSGIRSAQECTDAGGTWNPADEGNCS